MSRNPIEPSGQDFSHDDRNRAFARFKAGPFEAQATVDISPKGLVAIGAMVSMILLSVVPIVKAANRKIPPAD